MDNFENILDLDNTDLFNMLTSMQNQLKTTKTQSSKNENNALYCHNCKTDTFSIFDNYTIICTKCGYILNNELNSSPEWHAYDGDSKGVSRCTTVTDAFLPNSSLGTNIGGRGNYRLKKLHQWSAMPYRERSLNKVLQKIRRVCRDNNILKYNEDDAVILYKNISECKHKSGRNQGKPYIIRGRNRRGLIAACVLFACKRNGNTRSTKEIAEYFELTPKDVTKGSKTFLKMIKLTDMDYDLNPSTPKDFIKRFCKTLHFNQEITNQIFTIVKNIKKLNIGTKHTPLSIAIGTIALVIDINNIHLTKKTLSYTFDISEVTIGKALEVLKPFSDILIDDQKANKLLIVLSKKKEESIIPDDFLKRFANIN